MNIKINKRLFKSLLIVSPIILTAIPLTSCSDSGSPDEKEIEKCNYTVKVYQQTSDNNSLNLYIGTGIKGYVSGKLFIDNLTTSFTCVIVGSEQFVGANIYIPKWVDVNGVIYKIISISGSYDAYANYEAKVVLPDSIAEIGDCAFYESALLTNLILSDSIVSIGYAAFCGCTGLIAINLPRNITSIGGEGFAGCTGLTSINLPHNITSIAFGTFRGCTSLTSINIPQNITSIGGSAFENCANMTSFNLPQNITSIDGFAFANCTNMTSIDIPNSVTTLGAAIFGWCTNLISIIIPNSVTSIGSSSMGPQTLFGECTNLKTIFFSGFAENPKWPSSNLIFSEVSDQGTLYTINGSWQSNDALEFCKLQGLPPEWIAG